MRFGILTVSDRSARGEREDLSGPELAKRVAQEGWEVARTGLVADEVDEIRGVLLDWASSGEVDVVLTTGGTGFSQRDVTPEATLQIIERRAPGLEEAMRGASREITAMAMLSRGVAGMRGKVLIANLPGSPMGAAENLAVILPVLEHAVQLLRGAPKDGHPF